MMRSGYIPIMLKKREYYRFNCLKHDSGDPRKNLSGRELLEDYLQEGFNIKEDSIEGGVYVCRGNHISEPNIFVEIRYLKDKFFEVEFEYAQDSVDIEGLKEMQEIIKDAGFERVY